MFGEGFKERLVGVVTELLVVEAFVVSAPGDSIGQWVPLPSGADHPEFVALHRLDDRVGPARVGEVEHQRLTVRTISRAGAIMKSFPMVRSTQPVVVPNATTRNRRLSVIAPTALEAATAIAQLRSRNGV